MVLLKTCSKILFSILICSPLLINAQTIIIKGSISDKKTSLPIAYTSVGVKNKPFGTVADSLGNFSFVIAETSITDLDTVVFTTIGYNSVRKSLKDLRVSNLVISLSPSNVTLLNEVNITAYQQGKMEQYGRLPATVYLTPRAYKSIPRSDAKGREQATILDVDHNIVLKEIIFFLSRSNYTKVVYRINFYSVVNDIPGSLLSTKDIIYETEKTQDWQSVNLEPYQVRFVGQKKIAIGFQLIATEILPNDTAKTSFLIASYPSPLKKSYFREKSESEWMPVKSSYLYVNLKAYSIKGKLEKPIKEVVEMAITDQETKDLKLEHEKLLFGNNFDLGKHIAVDSGSIYYESYGRGEPLILLHGNNESMTSLRAQLQYLSEKFKVIAIDTRGQGNSKDLSVMPYSYELFAKDIIHVMDKLGVKKANVLGWSDGGNIGLIMASKYPDRVNKLAIFGANLFSGKEAIAEEIIQLFEKRKADLMKTSKANTSELRLTNLVLQEPNISIEQLKAIKIPVLVMAGEKDVVKLKHTELISQSIHQSRLYIFPDGDHYVPLKQPAPFNKIVTDFMLGK